MDKKELTRKIKMKGLELGFSKVGMTNADDFIEYEQKFAAARTTTTANELPRSRDCGVSIPLILATRSVFYKEAQQSCGELNPKRLKLNGRYCHAEETDDCHCRDLCDGIHFRRNGIGSCHAILSIRECRCSIHRLFRCNRPTVFCTFPAHRRTAFSGERKKNRAQ